MTRFEFRNIVDVSSIQEFIEKLEAITQYIQHK
jgi:hypothetical protein